MSQYYTVLQACPDFIFCLGVGIVLGVNIILGVKFKVSLIVPQSDSCKHIHPAVSAVYLCQQQLKQISVCCHVVYLKQMDKIILQGVTSHTRLQYYTIAPSQVVFI